MTSPTNDSNSVMAAIQSVQQLNATASAAETTDPNAAAFADIPNYTHPDPGNTAYNEIQLISKVKGSWNPNIPTKTRRATFYVGSIPSKEKRGLLLKGFTAADLQNLTAADFSVASGSMIQAGDVKLDFTAAADASSHPMMAFEIQNQATMNKIYGAGAPIKLIVKQPSNPQNTATVTLGIWQNCNASPSVTVPIAQNFAIQYFFNAYKDLTPGTISNDVPQEMVPNFNFLDGSGSNIQRILSLYYDSGSSLSSLYNVAISPDLQGADDFAPTDHLLIELNPNNSQQIIASFDVALSGDATLANMYFRAQIILQPTVDGSSMLIAQRIINYTNPSILAKTGGKTPELDYTRLYDTKLANSTTNWDLTGGDGIPIYFLGLASSGKDSGHPRGLYFSDHTGGFNYRMNFDFSSPDGPDGWMGTRMGNYFSDATDPGQNIVPNIFTGESVPDNIAYNGSGADGSFKDPTGYTPDSSIIMQWMPDQIGQLAFGQSSPIMAFNATGSRATAPTIRTAESQVNYFEDPSSTSLPPLTLNGTTQDIDSSQITVYYSIDKPIDPGTITETDAQKSGRLLTTVPLTSSDNTNFNWVKFPGTPAITNQADLKTLATPIAGGHTIYLYAFDNGGPSTSAHQISNVVDVGVQPYSSIQVRYEDTDGNQIQPDKTYYGQPGGTYSTTDTTYFPTTITQGANIYDLTTLPVAVNGTFPDDPTNVTLVYQSKGTIGLTSVPDLNFGGYAMNFPTGTYNLDKNLNSGQLAVNDTLPNKQFTVSAQVTTPLTSADGQKTLNNAIGYLTASGTQVSLNTNQSIYQNTNANTTATDFDISAGWWNAQNKQVSGPVLVNDGTNQTNLSPQTYTGTVTWSVTAGP